MALADSTKVDFLWKKLGFGVAKTAPPSNKEAFNESIPSPLLMRGDKVWQQSGDIPGVKPAATSSIVQIYQDAAGGSATVECTEDLTAPDNQTWKTNLTDWIPTEFGSTYLVKVYVDSTGAAAPQSTGTQLFQSGSGNEDGWFFDYQAGVLNFNGDNIPSQIDTGVTGKSIYIVGARYVGPFGVGGGTSIGNLTITDTTIGTTNAGSDIILEVTGNGTVQIDTTTALGIAVGNTSQRPVAPATGDLRYNTSTNAVEIYNGISWENVGGNDFGAITTQTLNGDNSTVAFTLDQSASTAGIIVSINGTLQQPVSAYSVSGTTITFTEAPESGDAIEIRFITQLTVFTSIQNASGNASVSTLDNEDTVQITGNLLPSANATYNLGSNTARWNDLYLAGSTLILGNVVMKNTPGGNSIAFYGPDGTTPATIDANVEIVSDSIAAGTSNVSFAGGGGNVQIIVGSTQTGTITSTGANITGYVTATGNITANYFKGDGSELTGVVASSVAAANVSGLATVATTGAYTDLSGTPTIPTATSDLTNNSGFIVLGNLSVTTNAASGDGSLSYDNSTGVFTFTPADAGLADYGDANVASFLGSNFGSNAIVTTGNITASNFIGEVTGNVSGSAATATSATTAGTVTANAQPNITSVGTLSSVTVTGNVSAGNVNATIVGNVTGNLTGNVTGNADTATTADALTTARAIEVSGAVTGTANFDGSAAINIVTTNTADPTITLSGAVTGSGTLTNLGNVTIATTATSDPTITLTGAVTGSGTLTNLGNVSIATTNTADPTITLAGDLSGSATLTNLGDATLTATIAANSVALGTDTTGNYIATGAVSGVGLSGSSNSEGGTFTVTSNATNANTPSTIVARDASGNFSAGTITALATSAQYADVAENFKVNEQADAGTVMVFDKDGLLVICNSYADPMLVGIVSTDPAYLLNSDQPDGQPIALAGQVPCKVVGPVKVGDLLTTSKTPGYATVLELNDWKPGIIVGKAMENCSIGKHTIKVFVGTF